LKIGVIPNSRNVIGLLPKPTTVIPACF